MGRRRDLPDAPALTSLPGGRRSPSTLAIDASGLSRRYGRRWVLVDVALEVGAGEVWMVAGRNGAGKSTLLRILATALRPDLGSGRVAGFDLVAERDEVRRRSGLLGHHSYAYSALTARENLAIAARLMGRPANAEALIPLLARVGLAEWAEEPVASFSAGMRKRLALARVLLQEAAVVLLDEPYGELDPQGFALVDSILDELRQRGAAVLVATHLLERGAELSDRALVLERGRAVWSGPAREMRAGLPTAGGGAGWTIPAGPTPLGSEAAR